MNTFGDRRYKRLNVRIASVLSKGPLTTSKLRDELFKIVSSRMFPSKSVLTNLLSKRPEYTALAFSEKERQVIWCLTERYRRDRETLIKLINGHKKL